jgi:hypothetical protein
VVNKVENLESPRNLENPRNLESPRNLEKQEGISIFYNTFLIEDI